MTARSSALRACAILSSPVARAKLVVARAKLLAVDAALCSTPESAALAVATTLRASFAAHWSVVGEATEFVTLDRDTAVGGARSGRARAEGVPATAADRVCVGGWRSATSGAGKACGESTLVAAAVVALRGWQVSAAEGTCSAGSGGGEAVGAGGGVVLGATTVRGVAEPDWGEAERRSFTSFSISLSMRGAVRDRL
jgi:hypothetical protein